MFFYQPVRPNVTLILLHCLSPNLGCLEDDDDALTGIEIGLIVIAGVIALLVLTVVVFLCFEAKARE